MRERTAVTNFIIRLGLLLVGVAGFLWLTNSQRSIIDILIIIGVSLLPAAITLIVPLTVYILIALFRRYMPVEEHMPIDSSQAVLEENIKWQLIGGGLFLISWPTGTFLSLRLLSTLAVWYFDQIPAVYLVPLDKLYWLLVPVVLTGMLFGIALTSAVSRAMLKSRYKVLSAHYDQTMGFDNKKVGNLIVGGTLLLASVMIFVGLTSYTRFTEEGIYTRRPYFLQEEFHSYDEVVAVRQVTNGSQQPEEQRFIIEYAEGGYWRTAPLERPKIPAKYIAIMEYVADKSGKEFIQVVEKRDE